MNPDGLYLVMKLVVRPADGRGYLDTPQKAIARFNVVRGFQLATAIAEGWRLVCEDPEPDRYAQKEDDCA